MRFLLAVMVVMVGISGSFAQQGTTKETKAKPSTTRADLAPKSTVGVPERSAASSSSAKQLKTIERQTPKGSGHTGQKAAKPVAMKPNTSDKNPPMNFGTKSNAQGVGMTKQASPYKGRLKQKGAGHGN
ncbi:MAG: hypothetical protein ABSG70_02495 [Terriglobales bacterium]|jgi:hypothetical protein